LEVSVATAAAASALAALTDEGSATGCVAGADDSEARRVVS
jgi:hypothetical protein